MSRRAGGIVVSRTKPMRTYRSFCAALACGAVLCGVPAFAEERGSLPAATPLAEAASAEPAERAAPVPRVRITVGPQGVQAGEARYAERSTVAGTAMIVEFATSPPRPSARMRSGGVLPVGMPVSAARLTSGFGMRTHPIRGGARAHAGIDLAAPYGSPVFATSDGVVGAAGWSGGYGLMITIGHGDGIQTRYGHLSRLNVAAGQEVVRGDVIGFVGSTGESTGPHVHYEVRVDGAALDPLRR